jgi:hypothetical protein
LKTIKQWQEDVHELATVKGWWGNGGKQPPPVKDVINPLVNDAAKLFKHDLDDETYKRLYRTIEAAVYDAYRKGIAHQRMKGRVIEAILMLHTEISELVEDIRVDNMKPSISPVNGKPVGAPTELADIGIRLLDLCEAMGVDLEDMIHMKHKYNGSRPYRHGGKRL